MGQRFCTACGAKLTEGRSFCEHCGTRVEQGTDASPAILDAENPQVPAPPPESGGRTIPLGLLAGIVIVLVVIGVGVLFVLPALTGGELPAIPGAATTEPTTVPTPEPTPVPADTPVIPTATPDPFPGALALKERVSFGEGSVASDATVYRFWINDTYQWHNDMDNRYRTYARAGSNRQIKILEGQKKGS